MVSILSRSTPLFIKIEYSKFRRFFWSSIGAFAFVPLLNPIAKALNGSCYSFVVKLTADNNIDYISFKVLTNSFYNDISECKLTFENVGTTELPGYIFIEEK